MDDLITIIIPTYNRGEFIGRCLRSISSQSFKNYEIIVIDNHSTDNTESIVKSFSNLPINYFIVENKNNIARSRNFGIKKSKGYIIAFLDSDDYWDYNKLDSCYQKIIQGYDLVYHNLKVVSDNNFFNQKSLIGRKFSLGKTFPNLGIYHTKNALHFSYTVSIFPLIFRYVTHKDLG